jgi:hypothetical protein
MNDKINYKSAQYILGSIGTLGGLYYAFSKNKSALSYIGFALVGGIAGGIIGSLYDNSIKPVVEKALPPTDNAVKNDLLNSKYDRTGMPLIAQATPTTRPMQPSPVSAESDMMDAQMKNFL